MAIDLQEFQKLKTRVKARQDEAQRVAGALESQMKILKDEFSLTTVETAEARLQELTEQEEAAEAKYVAELELVREKFPEVFS